MWLDLRDFNRRLRLSAGNAQSLAINAWSWYDVAIGVHHAPDHALETLQPSCYATGGLVPLGARSVDTQVNAPLLEALAAWNIAIALELGVSAWSTREQDAGTLLMGGCALA